MKYVVILIFCINTVVLASPLDLFTSKMDVDKANRLLRKGDYDGAITLYEKALSKVTNSSVLYYDMALAMASKGENDTAISLFDMAKKTLNDKSGKKVKNSVYYNSGISHIEGRNYKSAVNDFIEALVNDPKDDNAKRALEYARKRIKEEEGKGREPATNNQNDNSKDMDETSEEPNRYADNENKGDSKQNENLNEDDIDRLLNSLRQLRKESIPKDQRYSGGKIEKDW